MGTVHSAHKLRALAQQHLRTPIKGPFMTVFTMAAGASCIWYTIRALKERVALRLDRRPPSIFFDPHLAPDLPARELLFFAPCIVPRPS